MILALLLAPRTPLERGERSPSRRGRLGIPGAGLASRPRTVELRGLGILQKQCACTEQNFHLFQIQGEDFCERNRGVSPNPRGGFPRGWHPDNYPQPGSISNSGVTRSPVSVSASLHLLLLGVNPLPLPSEQADGAAPNGAQLLP